MRFDMENVDQIALPAAPTRLLRLRSAESGRIDDESQRPPVEVPE
jgi:hypothetical protein